MSDDGRNRNPVLRRLSRHELEIKALKRCFRDMGRRVRNLEAGQDEHEARIVDLLVGLPTKKPRR